MVALPVATLIAGPLSGVILDHVHWFDIESWRWVFILKGFPAVLLGFVACRCSSTARTRRSGSTPTRPWLTDTLDAENPSRSPTTPTSSFLRSLAGTRTLALALIYYSKSVAIYVLAFFTPAIVANLGDQLSNTSVGVLTAIPYAFAAVFMVWWARHSDRNRERRWHVGMPLFTAAAGLMLDGLRAGQHRALAVLLIVITVAVYATYGPFWSLPSLFLTGAAAAVGMASINSIANLGGFVGPFGFGALEDATGSIYWGLSIVAIVLLIAAGLVIQLRFVKKAEANARALATDASATV